MNDKRSSKKHFLESESGFKRLLDAFKNDVPSVEALAGIRNFNIRAGKLDVSKFPGTAAFYIAFLSKAERKSMNDVAKELGVSVTDLKLLQNEKTFLQEKSLFEFCEIFVEKRPQFSLRPLYATVKRAMVLHAMTSNEASLKKAARKKPPKK
jgi:hypothetical protein